MPGWTVVVPVKPWHLGKSRLATARRAELARAFTLDVLDAVTGSPDVDRVVVVSAEPALATAARRRDLALVVDRPLLSRDRLNTAIDLGRRWALRDAPRAPVVVVPADLPCLDAATTSEVLHRLERHDRAHVPDLGAGGTTLVAAARPADLTFDFGGRSAERHARLGLVRVADVPLAARRDVDTLADLAQVATLGLAVGPRTAEATGSDPGGPGPNRGPGAHGSARRSSVAPGPGARARV